MWRNWSWPFGRAEGSSVRKRISSVRSSIEYRSDTYPSASSVGLPKIRSSVEPLTMQAPIRFLIVFFLFSRNSRSSITICLTTMGFFASTDRQEIGTMSINSLTQPAVLLFPSSSLRKPLSIEFLVDPVSKTVSTRAGPI